MTTKTCSIKRIALFLPRPTPFYTTLFKQMKEGFEQAGFSVGGYTNLLGQKELLEFCRSFRPEAIFEMNRSRVQIPYLPPDIIHIGWIVDLLGGPYTYYGESEILYFFEERRAREYPGKWLKKYGTKPKCLSDWLPPGHSPDTYYREKITPSMDFSFIGHIPSPWREEELHRVIGDNITFEDFYNCCKDKKHTARFYKYGEKEVARVLGQPIFIEGQKLKYDVYIRIGRMLCRVGMMRCLLSSNASIRIYGPDNWQKWGEFSTYYDRFLNTPDEIRHATLCSRIGVHEGYGTHFRLFDIMATGRCVFFHKNPFRTFKDPKSREIELLFEPDKHFIYFDDGDVHEKSKYYLNNNQAREKIVQEAYKLVHAKHKWSDRALKIKKDLEKVR